MSETQIAPQAMFSERIPGLVWGYRFDADGKATTLEPSEELRLDTPGEGFVWVHFNLTNQRVRDWLLGQEALQEPARNVLAGGAEHQQLVQNERQIWGVIPDLTREFDKTSDAVGYLRFVLGERFLVSARRHPLQSAEAARLEIEAGLRVSAPVALFETIVDRIADAISKTIDANIDALNAIEDRILDSEIHDESNALGAIRRASARAHRQLNGMHTIFHRFEAQSSANLSEEVRAAAARLVQRISSLHEEVQSTQDRARLLHEELASQISSQTNRNLAMLTVVTTLFLPPTLVTGMFGMNVKGLLFGDDEYGYWYAMAICVVSSGLVYLLMRRIGVVR